MTIKSLTTKAVIAFGLLAACLLQTATYSGAQEKEASGSASSDDLKKLKQLLASYWDKTDTLGKKKKLIEQYNRACRDSCPDPCSDTYQIIIDEPNVIRACPGE